jgi:hypothetical protein
VNVSLGTNNFIDCDTIVSIKGQPTLKVEQNPLRLTIVTPTDLPSGRLVRVVANQLEPPSGASEVSPLVRVVATEKHVTVFWEQFLIAAATQLGENSVHVHIDFRPLGINVFDDVTGLHVGGTHFARSGMAGSQVAISLA